jgi:hypothetical protein
VITLQGIVHEFQPGPEAAAAAADPAAASYLLLINGLWGLLLAAGVLLSSLQVLQARSWLLGRGWLRGLLADYGVPLMVLAWSGLSFAVRPAPCVPRRVSTPNTWEVRADGSWHGVAAVVTCGLMLCDQVCGQCFGCEDLASCGCAQVEILVSQLSGILATACRCTIAAAATAAAAAACLRCCQVVSNWSVAWRLHEVPGSYIAAALLPALIITVLFYFDHSEYMS